MVYFRTPWEVVNGMWSARQRGHGWVSTYLRQVGVPRSTGYRWEGELRWLAEFGAGELERVRAECVRLRAEVACGEAERSVEASASRARERALILEAAVLGTSDTEIARLVWTALGRAVSHETVNAVIAEASRRAPEVFARHFAGVGRVGAADEIFLGRTPLLLVVEPGSLLVSGLGLGDRRTAAEWEPVFATMEDLERCACDGGTGVNAAARAAGLDVQGDLFHGLRDAEAWLSRFTATCDKRLAVEENARAVLKAATERKQRQDAASRHQRTVAEADAALAEWVRLSDLWTQARGAFDLVTPEGRLNTPASAQATLRTALAAMERTPEGLSLSGKLKPVKDPRFFAHLRTLERDLSRLGLDQVGPEREAALGRLVAETVAWRRRDKDPVSFLRAASTGSLADETELAVIEAVDRAVRSSSSVECVNSRIRLVQVARKRLGEDFLYLLAVYHNMHSFGRGSVREGNTPAELAGIVLPTSDWIELLDYDADEACAVRDPEAAPSAPAPPADRAKTAA
ncbi:MAG: hypothetical protein FJ291_32020 [Planctomycetes bacterium]|nr:hypothetical protein [Planctomycetota bacterium]